MPGSPLNLTTNNKQSAGDVVLHWKYADQSNDSDLSYFNVNCINMTVDTKSHAKIELNILIKINNATLIKINNAKPIGLLAYTVYTCCVSAVFPYMETDSTCINV